MYLKTLCINVCQNIFYNQFLFFVLVCLFFQQVKAMIMLVVLLIASMFRQGKGSSFTIFYVCGLNKCNINLLMIF